MIVYIFLLYLLLFDTSTLAIVKEAIRFQVGDRGLAPGLVEFGDSLGSDLTLIGDVDGDNIDDIAIGAPYKSITGANNEGVVFILFMNADDTVREINTISTFTTLNADDAFGSSIASLGDFDGDNIPDIAVGAKYDDSANFFYDGNTVYKDMGAVYIIMLQNDGSVKSFVKLWQDITPHLVFYDYFGTSIDSIGDLDGDGITDIAVGRPQYDGASFNCGAVDIIFLNSDGTIKSTSIITDNVNGFRDIGKEYFGGSIASIGDLDGDNVNDLAVGATGVDSTTTDTGGIYIIFK